MKIRFFSTITYLFLILFFSFFLLLGCTLPRMMKLSQEQKVTVQPQILEVSGENILLEVKAQVPKKMINKKAVYGIELSYRYGLSQEDPVGRIAFKPGDFIYEDSKPTIIRQYSIPYSPKKNPGQLMMQGVASTPKGQEKRTPWQELAKGVVTTSKLVAHSNSFSYVPDTYLKKKQETSTITLFYDKGEFILKNYLGTTIHALADFIVSNEKTNQVQITAAISPEAEELKNPQLAAQRAQRVQLYYKNKLDESGYVNSSKSIKFKTATLKTNWDLFLKKIQHSALSADDIQQILDILNEKGSMAEKEAKLQQLESHEYLDLYVFPTLRFAEVKINYTPTRKKDYEIFLLSRKIAEGQEVPEALTEQELRYAATLTPLLAEKQKIYETAVATSNHWQAYHNLGIVYLQMAKQELRPAYKNELLNTSIKNLTYASHRNPAAQTFYHLAAAHHLKGNQLEALQSYDYAIKLGGSITELQKVFSDKAALELQIGQVDDALYSLSYAGTSYQNYINKGLSYLLKGNYEQAAKFYEEALRLKPNDALAYYSLAVLAARTKDENLLATHLQKAVRADKSFTQKAIEDLEFRAYAQSNTFQAALK